MPNKTDASAAKDAALRYENFVDPLGLVVRMLRDTGARGRALLATELLAKLAKPLDLALAGRDRRLRENAPPSSLPLLLVIGPPRSGTTLVHQALAYRLDVAYFTNRNAMFPRSPIAAARLLDRRFRPRGDFQSLYGKTATLNGPSDAFHIWDRFFGEDHYRAQIDESPAAADELRRFFDAWFAVVPRPLLNKNNRNVHCLAYLARALPNARFVIIERNPLFVAQSLVRARKWIQGDERIGWGLESESVGESDDPLAPVDAACRQVQRCHQRLGEQLAKIDANRVLQFSYEQFCHAPEECARACLVGDPSIAIRSGSEPLPSFEVSERWSAAPEVVERIRQRLGTVEASATS